MKDLEACMQYIEKHEGNRLYVYEDTKGIPTVGVGINLREARNNQKLRDLFGEKFESFMRGEIPVERTQLRGLFKSNVETAIEDAKHFFDGFDQLSSARQIVLVDMAFNLGRPKLMEFGKLKKALQNNEPDRMYEEVLDSDYARDVKNRAMHNATALKTEVMPFKDILLSGEAISAIKGHLNPTGQSNEEIVDSVRRMLDGQDDSTKNTELEALKSGDGAFYLTTVSANEHVHKVRETSVSLAQDLENKQKKYDKALEASDGDFSAREVMQAKADLEDAKEHLLDFQSTVSEAEQWARYGIRAVSLLARATGNDKFASDLEFYGEHLIQAGVSIALIYSGAGTIQGIAGLGGSVLAMMQGKPKRGQSAEQQIFNYMFKQFNLLKEELHDIKKNQQIILSAIYHLGDQLEDISQRINHLTRLSAAIYIEVQELHQHVRHESRLTAIVNDENRRMFTDFYTFNRALKNGDKIDAKDAEAMHRTWNVFTQDLARLQSVLAATEPNDDVSRFYTLLKTRSIIGENKPDYARGLLHTADLLFRYAESMLGLRSGEPGKSFFERHERNDSDGSVSFAIVNLPIWVDGVKAQLFFFHSLMRQNMMQAYLDEVGKHAVINAVNLNMHLANHTLGQLNRLAGTQLIAKLANRFVSEYAKIVDAYRNHSYKDDQDEGLGLQWFRDRMLKFRSDLLNGHGHPGKISSYLPRTRDFDVKKIWTKDDAFVKRRMQDRLFTFSDEFQLSQDDVLVNDSYSFFSIGSASTERQVTLRKLDGLDYPGGLSFKTTFGHQIGEEEYTVGGGRDRETRTREYKIPVYVHIQAYKLEHVNYWEWDQALFRMRRENCYELAFFRSAEDKTKILSCVNTPALRKQFELLNQYQLLLSAAVQLLVAYEPGVAAIHEALQQFKTKQDEMVAYMAEGMLIEEDWRKPTVDIDAVMPVMPGDEDTDKPSFIGMRAHQVKASRRLSNAVNKCRSPHFFETNHAKQVIKLVGELELRKSQIEHSFR
ncbi:MAG: hypothetical protein DHS20C10_02120 [marine bacterium B5-7]|nr:MAG: hypothetical protein DHS20C10_02120 [marine bacterium B5-7]